MIRFSSRFNHRYLLPGLKRWIAIFTFGILCIVFGIALLLELRPLTAVSSFIWEMLRSIALAVPAHISGPLILVIGTGSIIGSLFFGIRTVLRATSGDDPRNASTPILKALERARRRGQGPKIAAIGGGTGLSTVLRGIKNYSSNVHAIVTVGDDGGSSGRLRTEMGMVPPGDIRNCIVALSDEEEVLTSLFSYRFKQGSLAGHSLGNLFLAALCNICGDDMAKASQIASRILRTGGQVLPSSLAPIYLEAELDDGSRIWGESNIPKAELPISRVTCTTDSPPALKESVRAIREADLIVLGPGSLFTSVIPNLLMPDIVQAIKESPAKVLFICNLVCDSETEGYKASDFVSAINSHAGCELIDAVLVNEPSVSLRNSGKAVEVDHCGDGVEVVFRSKLCNDKGRHNSLRLARSIMQWYYSADRNVLNLQEQNQRYATASSKRPLTVSKTTH